MVIYDDEAQDLAVAIVQQAIDDYWKATAKLKAIIKKMACCSAKEKKKWSKMWLKQKFMIWDCISFFVDPWFEILIDIPFSKIADRIRDENPYVCIIKPDINGVDRVFVKRKKDAPTLICGRD